MRVGSLCTGYGGLDMAVGGELAFVSDIDAHVNRLLDARYPGVPNIGDLTARPDAPQVDAVTAGFPCQPVSTAGRRKGTDDERWIFDDILAFVGRMDPLPVLYLENVPGLLSANGGDAMARVVEGLASVGYVGRYRLLRASDVGACHRRERWFCIAVPQGRANGAGLTRPEPLRDAAHPGGEPAQRLGGPRLLAGTPRTLKGDGEQRQRSGDAAADSGQAALPTINGAGRHGTGGLDLRTAIDTLPTPTAVQGRNATSGPQPDAQFNTGTTLEDVRFADRWGDYAAAIARHETTLGRPAPDPTTDGRLNPVFVEWMMMLPEGWVTGLDLSRTAQLRILGNGVVPAQAQAAYLSLLEMEAAA